MKETTLKGGVIEKGTTKVRHKQSSKSFVIIIMRVYASFVTLLVSLLSSLPLSPLQQQAITHTAHTYYNGASCASVCLVARSSST